MPKITGDETFTQLYQKMTRLQGRKSRVKGARMVSVSSQGQLGTARVSFSSAPLKRASDHIVASMKKEYGAAVTEKVLQHVVGRRSDQRPVISLSQLKAIKHELKYHQPIDGNARAITPGGTFTGLLQGVTRGRGNKSGSKHLRFKSSKGLYFHQRSLGSALGIGNLLSGENPIDKRAEAGPKVWKSLANEYGEKAADEIFVSVFGRNATDGKTARRSVNLDQFDRIAHEVKTRLPKAPDKRQSTKIYNKGLDNYDSQKTTGAAIIASFHRVDPGSKTHSIEDDRQLKLYRADDSAHKAMVIDSNELDDDDMGDAWKDPVDAEPLYPPPSSSKPRIEEELDPDEEPDRDDSRLPKDSMADAPPPLALAGGSNEKPRTKYQQNVAAYTDDIAGAFQALGDTSAVVGVADMIDLSRERLRNLKRQQGALQAILGLGRAYDGQHVRDEGGTSGDRTMINMTAALASLLENAKQGHVKIEKSRLKAYRAFLLDVGARMEARLADHSARDSRLRELGQDLKRLGAQKTRPGQVGGAAEPSKLEAWHLAKKELAVLQSKIDMLSGENRRAIREGNDKARLEARTKISRYQKELLRLDAAPTDPRRKELERKIAKQRATIRRSDLLDDQTVEDRKRVLRDLGIDEDDHKAIQQTLEQLRKQRDQKKTEVALKKQEHIDDPLTQKMVAKYSDLGFEADKDYLAPRSQSALQAPMLQAPMVGAMHAATTRVIPGLVNTIDDLLDA